LNAYRHCGPHGFEDMASCVTDRPGWRANGPWHEDELQALMRAWKRGDSITEIAEAHGRSRQSVARELVRARLALDVGPDVTNATAITTMAQPA
jgi:hypothetical protein